MCMKKGIAKRLFAMLIAFIIILCPMADNTVHAASIAMPILPYVPPNSAQIMDLISNAFGVTAPAIEDAAEKFQAYLNIYQTILGASYDSFKEDLDDIIDDAKTSGTITINQNASTIIQQALNKALQDGYEHGESLPNATSPEQWVSRLAMHGITMTIQQATELKIMIDSGGWFGNQTPYTLGVDVGEGQIQFMPYYINTTPQPHFVPHPNVAGYYMFEVTVSSTYKPNVSPVYVYNINMNNLTVGTFNRTFSGGNALKVEQGLMFTLGVTSGEVASVQAQSQSVVTSLSTGAVVPITADTDINDMTGDVKIRIPAVTIYPAETVEDLPGVQDELGVMPTTTDTTQAQLEDIIEQLQELQAAKYGDVSKYSINLTEYFPFCIPFDIGNILTMFVAEPEAPVVTFPMPVGYGEDGIIMQEFTLDLSQFDTVALWCRRGILLVFIVGLAMVTRKVFLRG